MPAQAKRFYSTADIQTVLGVSKSYANQLMHMFDKRGQLLRSGRLMRVEIKVFEDWVRLHTGGKTK